MPRPVRCSRHDRRHDRCRPMCNREEPVPGQPEPGQARRGVYRTVKADPRYVDDEGCELIGELTVEFGAAMRQPMRDRRVEVEVRFGDTDIFATAVNAHTRQQVETVLRFASAD